MTKRAVLYARVSSDDRGKDGRNLKGQLDICREYALSKGYTIIAELAEDDRGASGASWDLEKLNRALEMARAGRFDVLVVRELDRFARSLAKQLVVETEFRQTGIEVEYALADYDDSPEGNLMKNVRAVVAEYERLKINERMARGRHQLIQSGRVLLHGNQPPYGYRVTEDRTLEICEPEARIVQLVFKWYTEGDETGTRLGTKAIARKLTQMGVPTWVDAHRKGYKKRARGQWSDGTVSGILKRRTYLGRWYYGKRNQVDGHWVQQPYEQLLSVKVPSIITEETWEKAQRQKEINKARARRNRRYDYLLARRLTCGMSGHTVYARSTTTKNRVGQPYRYYQCAAWTGNIAGEDCDLPSFRVGEVDAAVWEWVKSFLADPVALAKALEDEQTEREKANEPLLARIAVIDDLLADHQRRLEKLLDLYLGGAFPRDVLSERKARLETTMKAMQEERASLVEKMKTTSPNAEQIETIGRFAALIRDGLQEADEDFETRRGVIEALDVRGSLAVEDGNKVIYVRCIVGSDVLPIENDSLKTI